MSGQETYDVSAKEKRILEARAARRAVLRHEYLKQIGNPYRMATGEGGTVFDSGIQRFLSMRASQLEHFRPNVSNSLFYFGGIILPMVLYTLFVVRDKDKQEHKYRTGQVSYRDRKYKFT